MHTSFLRRNAWVIVIAAVVIAAVVFAALAHQQRSASLADQREQISSLHQQVDAQRTQRSQSQAESLQKGLGIDADRVEDDRSELTALASIALTWDDGDSYDQARQTLIDRFDLDEKSGLLKDFMPPVRYNTDADGDRYYYIDAIGMHSSPVGDPEVQVLKVSGTDYTYLVEADAEITTDSGESRDQNGRVVESASGTRRVLFEVTVDGEGDVVSASATQGGEGTRESE